MSAAGLSDSDSGGRSDSCQTVPACPLPPFRKRPETSQGAAAPNPPPEPRPSSCVQGTEAARKGLKSLPNLGTGRGEGGARAPAAGGGRGSRVPGLRSAPAGGQGGGTEGFREAPGPKPSSAPRSGFRRRLHRASTRGSRGPSVKGAQPALPSPCRPRGAREPLIGPLAQTPRVRSPPPPLTRSGRDPPVGLAHLNLDLPRGTGAASPERASSSASGDGGVGRAREAGAAAGQPRSAFSALPRNS